MKFNPSIKAPIDLSLPEHIKQTLRIDPYGLETMKAQGYQIRDILLLLLLISLECRLTNSKFTPDNFTLLYQNALARHRERLLPPFNVNPDQLAIIVENWFLALYDFLLELYLDNKSELLLRLEFVQVVPHGIVFKEEIFQ